jgi:hypothetical protein
MKIVKNRGMKKAIVALARRLAVTPILLLSTSGPADYPIFRSGAAIEGPARRRE